MVASHDEDDSLVKLLAGIVQRQTLLIEGSLR
jgi:hypothetical protein